MHPVHDIDALLLLALLLSAKRRPAELVEIVAAADLLHGAIPSEGKLAEAVHRLSRHGLIQEIDQGLALTPEAEKIVSGQPKKSETEEKIFAIREKLAAYTPKGESAPIQIDLSALSAAVLAHQTASKSAAKNLLVPKPKPADEHKPSGIRHRKPLPARRRKD